LSAGGSCLFAAASGPGRDGTDSDHAFDCTAFASLAKTAAATVKSGRVSVKTGEFGASHFAGDGWLWSAARGTEGSSAIITRPMSSRLASCCVGAACLVPIDAEAWL